MAISTDGFQYLSTILHKTLPQFGGPHPDLTTEIQKLQVVSGETLSEFHKRAIHIHNTLIFSKITISKTFFFEHFLEQLRKTPSILPFLKDVTKRFRAHKRQHGDNIAFSDSFSDLYQDLLDSDCPVTLNADSRSSFCPEANAVRRHRPSYPPCDACGRSHQGGAEQCIRRGLWFQSPSDRLLIQRYNAIHGDKPKIPVPEPSPKPSQAFHSEPQNLSANSASSSPLSNPVSVISDEIPSGDIDDDNNVYDTSAPFKLVAQSASLHLSPSTDTGILAPLLDFTPPPQPSSFRPAANSTIATPLTSHENPELINHYFSTSSRIKAKNID